MLRAFDLAAVAEAKPFDGVVALPLGESTARGINARVLKHDADNDHHFADAGRLFKVEMLLNAFSIASAAEPDRAATPEPAPWWFADKDARCYVGRYADLTRHFCAGGRCDLQKARDHYREHGRHEARKYGCGDSSPAIVSSRGETLHPFRVAVCFWGVHLCARLSCHDSCVRSPNLISAQA